MLNSIMPLVRIDDIKELENSLKKVYLALDTVQRDTFSFFCPKELELRHAEVTLIASPLSFYYSLGGFPPATGTMTHQVFKVVCGNCRSESIFFHYRTRPENRLILIHPENLDNQSSGIYKEMQYYISQARRSHSVGANSAAVAMYRAALEQFLYHEGYTEGMLNQKIRALETAMAGENPPRWSRDFDMDYLEIIKQLGNTAIHPNRGDISLQNALDAELIANLELVFADIIDKAFEAPAREAARKAKLRGGISPK